MQEVFDVLSLTCKTAGARVRCRNLSANRVTQLKAQYLLRSRPPSEKLVDGSFKNLVVVMASMVALVLISILVVVFWGSLESMGRYGLNFLITSNWNPVDDEYGAFTAIYGTLVTSLLALVIAVPLGVGTAIFITEDIIPQKIRNISTKKVSHLISRIPLAFPCFSSCFPTKSF